jgi:hypothetical protein
LAFFANLNDAQSEESTDSITQDSHPTLSLGTGSETVPQVLRPITKSHPPAARLHSLYAPFGETAHQAPAWSASGRPSSFPAYQGSSRHRDTAASKSSLPGPGRKKAPQRSFSWAALAGSSGQNEIDDVFE